MESAQFKNMQNIENNLAAIKARIEKLARIEDQKEEEMNKLILGTVPVVDKKMKEN